MKQFLPRLVLFGISGVLLLGCKGPPSSPQKTPVSPVLLSVANPDPALDDSDAPDEDPSWKSFSSGNPESLAHYAAGMSYALSDKVGLALEQFYQSALSDPTNEPLVIEVSRNLIAKKQPHKAAELLKKSAQRPEASAAIFIWLGQANFYQGNTNEALSLSKAAIKRNPELLDAYESLFGLYLKVAQTNQARQVLQQASKRADSLPDLIALGEMYGIYLKSCPHDGSAKAQGAKILTRAAANHAFPDALLIPLAQAYEHVGELMKCAEIYQKILDSDSKLSVKREVIREKLANIYLQAQDKKGAAEQLEAMVRDNPTHSPQAWFMLGQLALDGKQLTNAEGAFQKAILLQPDNEQAYYELALVQLDLKKFGEALQNLDRVREKFPNTFAGEFVTGLAYYRLKSYAEAMKHFTAAEVIAKATEPKRLNLQFFFQLGATCERNKQYKEAADYFEKCLKIDPNDEETMNYLGYMWAERGENLDRAHQLIEKAVKMQPKNAAFLDSLGWVLFKLNKPSQALPWLLKAQQLSEEPDATLYEHQGDVYSALHQMEKAREALKKSLEIDSNDAVKKKLDQLPLSAH